MEIPFKDAIKWEARMSALAEQLAPHLTASATAHPWHNKIGSFAMKLHKSLSRGRSGSFLLYVDYNDNQWSYIIPGKEDETEDYISPLHAHPYQALELYFEDKMRRVTEGACIQAANQDGENDPPKTPPDIPF